MASLVPEPTDADRQRDADDDYPFATSSWDLAASYIRLYVAERKAREAAERSRDDHKDARYMLASDLIALHEGKDVKTMLAEVVRLKMEAVERELDRWRHGNTIEGDFVCPNALRVAELEEVNAKLVAAMEECVGLEKPRTRRSIVEIVTNAKEALAAVAKSNGPIKPMSFNKTILPR